MRQAMKRRKRRGTITLLLLVSLVPLLTVLLTALDLARQQTDEALLVRAMRAQLQAALAQYDPKLRNEFGIWGVQAADLETAVLKDLAPARYEVQADYSVLTAVTQPDSLMAQVNRTMLPRLPLIWGQSLWPAQNEPQIPSDGLNEPAELDLPEPLSLLDEELDQELDDLEADLQAALSDAYEAEFEPKLKNKLSDLLGSVDEISGLRGDVAITAGNTLAGLALLSQVLEQGDRIRSTVDNPLTRRYLLAEYAVQYLTRVVTVRLDPATGDGQPEDLQTISGLNYSDLADRRPAEIERLLTGFEAKAASQAVRSSLTALRSVINLAVLTSDSDQMARLRSLAAGAAATVAALSGATVVLDPELLTWFFAVGEAIRRGLADYAALERGEAVDLIPDSLSPGLGNQWPQGMPQLDWHYADYLRLMLLTISPEVLLTRLADRIDQAFPEPRASAVRLSIRARDRKALRPMSGPLTFALELSYAQ